MKGIGRRFLPLGLSAIWMLMACGPGSASSTSIPVTSSTPSAVPIQHQTIPGDLPQEPSGHAGDHDSSTTAEQKRASGGDRFTFGRFERPFNAETMDVYFPYLDIQDVSLYQDDTWAYAAITVKGPDPNGELAGRFAVELDVDLDGRGDWLILAAHPASSEWSTEGVQAWADLNDDVGGSTAVDADSAGGDGYETQVFDAGHGQDPDAAWVRISPDDPNTVQLAGKLSLLGGGKAYLAGLWTGNGDLDPKNFDFNDHETHEQAGAALKEFEFFYPIKGLAELDNTCRMAVGFEPTGTEPGLCPLPGAPSEEGCNLTNAYCNNQFCTSGGSLDPVKCECQCVIP